MQLISTVKPIRCLLKIRAAALVRWLCCACVRAWLRVEEKQLLFRISGHLLPCHHLVIMINTHVLFASKWMHTIPTTAHSLLSATFLSESEWVAKQFFACTHSYLPSQMGIPLVPFFFLRKGSKVILWTIHFGRLEKETKTVLSEISVGGFLVGFFGGFFSLLGAYSSHQRQGTCVLLHVHVVH